MSNALVPQNEAAIMPVMDMEQAVGRYAQFKEFVGRVLVDGVDFGAIPGTDKNTLLKPGAEKLSTFFGLSKRFEIIESVEDWTGQNHGDEPFFYYLYRCSLYRGDLLVAESDGSCNSWEVKYRYRKQERVCPTCGAENIRKSKQGGWYCWAKTGGCGATFKDGDEAIEGQEVGRKPNPDIADQVNTFQKMAQKRALVAAVLIAVNASDYFTQDMEDFTNIPLKSVEDVVEGEFTEATPKPQQPKQQLKNNSTSPKQVAGMNALKMLEIVNGETDNHYNDVNHLRNGIRKALGDDKWDWPAPSDEAKWQEAQAVAIEYGNAPKGDGEIPF